MTRAFFVNNEIYMAFLLNSQAQGVSGKNEQSTQTSSRMAPEVRGPMQLHRLKAGPGAESRFAFGASFFINSLKIAKICSITAKNFLRARHISRE